MPVRQCQSISTRLYISACHCQHSNRRAYASLCKPACNNVSLAEGICTDSPNATTTLTLYSRVAISLAVHCSNGQRLWQWPGVSTSERTVCAALLGPDTVAALTTNGSIFTLSAHEGGSVNGFMKRLSVSTFLLADKACLMLYA